MRVEFVGEGQPNTEFAFPDPGDISGDLLPLVLNLQDGDIFTPATYRDMGYTHYEVWCIGAAGGRGGDGVGRPGYNGASAANIMSMLSWPYYFVGSVQHVHDPFISPSEGQKARGGGGGGGGLQVVSGLLIGLPDECPVVVGQAGADASLAQIDAPVTITNPTPPYIGSGVNDTPGTVWPIPQKGGDGGASSFNVNTCRASGGKGGQPGGRYVDTPGWPGYSNGQFYAWPGLRFMVDGYGGAGGVGGSVVAGGGGLGSESSSNSGSDGTFNVETGIGKGGGGGHGGANSPPPPGPQYGV